MGYKVLDPNGHILATNDKKEGAITEMRRRASAMVLMQLERSDEIKVFAEKNKISVMTHLHNGEVERETFTYEVIAPEGPLSIKEFRITRHTMSGQAYQQKFGHTEGMETTDIVLVYDGGCHLIVDQNDKSKAFLDVENVGNHGLIMDMEWQLYHTWYIGQFKGA
jgi:hypothetical protein